MAWKVEFTPAAEKALTKLDRVAQKRILRFLHERVVDMPDPRHIGKPLAGPTLSGLWRYRVSDYRILCRIEDDRICIVVVEIGHRRDVYKHR